MITEEEEGINEQFRGALYSFAMSFLDDLEIEMAEKNRIAVILTNMINVMACIAYEYQVPQEVISAQVAEIYQTLATHYDEQPPSPAMVSHIVDAEDSRRDPTHLIEEEERGS